MDHYREVFTTLDLAEINQSMAAASTPIPDQVADDQATYTFLSTIDGVQFTFTAVFVLENGVWKIERF